MRLTSVSPMAPNKFYALDTFSAVSLRRNGKVATGSYLQPPYAVRLSGDEPSKILLFDWTSPLVHTRYNTFRSTSRPPNKVHARLWKQFADLARADDEAVRRFSERWGPLGFPSLPSRTVLSEPLRIWRDFASLATAVLRCSIAIQQRRTGDAEDWKHLSDWLNRSYDAEIATAPWRDSVMTLQRRALVASALNRWYSESEGHNLLKFQGDKLVIAPSATTLFGILGLQLAYSITNAEPMLVCCHCTRFFTPQYKPATGVRTFCPACRKAGKPQMYAMRDYRARAQA